MQKKHQDDGESPQRLTNLVQYIRAAIPDPVSPFDSAYEGKCSILLDWLNAIHFTTRNNPADTEVLQSITQHHASMMEYDGKRIKMLQKLGYTLSHNVVGEGEVGDPDTTAMWKSSMMHSCLFGKTTGVHSRTEPLLLSEKDGLTPQQVLGDVKAHPQAYSVQELASFWAFNMRLDGLKKHQNVSPTSSLSLDRESSNLFIFRFPITKVLLSSSLTSGRNTMLPLMKDPDFIKILNKEFCAATERGRSFTSESISMDSIDDCNLFIQDCNRPIYGVKENGPAEKNDLENRGWTVESHVTEANKQLDDWFNIMARGPKECILSVRKDIWFIWVSNWMVHNQSCAYPMYETMLKHWNLTTCGFTMVDRIRKYNVIRKILSRLSRGREYQNLNYVLSPDHVDFDVVYGSLFVCLDMWNNSNAELQEALYESYEGGPILERSFLLGLVSAIMIKKHQVVRGKILIDLYAFVTGQPLESLPQYTLSDAKAITQRRDEITTKHPYILHVVETMNSANGQWNQLIRNASAVPSRNPMLVPVISSGTHMAPIPSPPPTGPKRKRKFGKPRPTTACANKVPSAAMLSVNDEMYFYDGTKHYVSTSYYGFGDCHFKQGRYRCDGDVLTKRRKVEANSRMGSSSMGDGSAEAVAYRKAQQNINKQVHDASHISTATAATYCSAYSVHNDNPPTSYAPITAKYGNALEDILENCGRGLTTAEKQYAHLWLDLGCLQELSLNVSRKRGNRAIREEFKKLQQRNIRMKKNRERNRTRDANHDDLNAEYDDCADDDTAKVANVWHRNVRLPKSSFYNEVQTNVPMSLVVLEYLVNKTLLAVCSCELFPIELRKELWISRLIQDDSTTHNNTNTQSKATPSANVVLVRDWKGTSKPSNDDIAAMSPTIISDMRAGITKDYVNLGKTDTIFSLYNHNSFTLSTKQLSSSSTTRNSTSTPLATRKFDPSKVHNRPNGGREYMGYIAERKREDRIGMKDYIRDLGGFEADEAFISDDGRGDCDDIDTEQQQQPLTNPLPKEEWLWQDDVLFGDDDVKQQLVTKLAWDEKNSTVPDTTRKVLAFLDYAHNTSLRDKCFNNTEIYNKAQRVPLYDMLLPYKPCYKGFQRSIVATKREHQRLFQNHKTMTLSPSLMRLPLPLPPTPTPLPLSLLPIRAPAPPPSFYISSFSITPTNTKQRRGRKGNGAWLKTLSKANPSIITTPPEPVLTFPLKVTSKPLELRCNRLNLAEKRTTCDDAFCLIFLTDYYFNTKDKKSRKKKTITTATAAIALPGSSNNNNSSTTAARPTATTISITHSMSQRPHVILEQYCIKLMTQKRCSSYFTQSRSTNVINVPQQNPQAQQDEEEEEEEEDISTPGECNFDTLYGKCSEPYNVQKLIQAIREFEEEKMKWELIDAKLDGPRMDDHFDKARKVLVMTRFR